MPPDSVLDRTLRSLLCAAVAQGFTLEIRYRPLRTTGVVVLPAHGWPFVDLARSAYVQALRATGGHQAAAADLLHVSPRVLTYQMPRRRITRQEIQGPAPRSCVVLPAGGCPLREILRQGVVQALAHVGGRQDLAAGLLHLSRRRLRYWVQALRLQGGCDDRETRLARTAHDRVYGERGGATPARRAAGAPVSRAGRVVDIRRHVG